MEAKFESLCLIAPPAMDKTPILKQFEDKLKAIIIKKVKKLYGCSVCKLLNDPAHALCLYK
jgi:protein required for attachment to host cells